MLDLPLSRWGELVYNPFAGLGVMRTFVILLFPLSLVYRYLPVVYRERKLRNFMSGYKIHRISDKPARVILEAASSRQTLIESYKNKKHCMTIKVSPTLFDKATHESTKYCLMLSLRDIRLTSYAYYTDMIEMIEYALNNHQEIMLDQFDYLVVVTNNGEPLLLLDFQKENTEESRDRWLKLEPEVFRTTKSSDWWSQFKWFVAYLSLLGVTAPFK